MYNYKKKTIYKKKQLYTTKKNKNIYFFLHRGKENAPPSLTSTQLSDD